MQVELTQHTVSSAFTSFTDGVQWLGRSITSAGKAGWEGTKAAVAAVAAGVATAWAAAKPVLTKIWDVVGSPFGIGVGLTALSGTLVALSSYESNDLKRAAMQGIGVCGALAAGLIVGKFAL